MKAIAKRLQELEQKMSADEWGTNVVIYDPMTNEPLEPIPSWAKVTVWLPDNGRDKKRGEKV